MAFSAPFVAPGWRSPAAEAARPRWLEARAWRRDEPERDARMIGDEPGGRKTSATGGEGALPGPEPAAPRAFEALFREHEDAVERLCRRMLGLEPARDARQEVFLRARRGFDSWDPARPFRRWLLAIAGNYCVDQLRRRGLEARLFDPRDFQSDDLLSPGPSPLREALHAERREELLAAIDELPDRYRLPLVLRYFQELDYDGIAALLGLSRAQVGTLLFRARRRLRTALADESPE